MKSFHTRSRSVNFFHTSGMMSPMCYSVQIQKDLEVLKRKFGALVNEADLALYQELQAKGKDPEFVKRALGLKTKPRSEFFKEPGPDGRIFPGYFAWIMVLEDGKRVFKKMRYRLRSKGSREEIPSKFNVFNARSDSLMVRQTWKPIFGRQHGLFPFLRFYEWVEHEGQKRIVSFNPGEHEIMWAPCLWDYWEAPDKSLHFHSFALITDEPPAEVAAAGHDRCPIFLKEEQINFWLETKGKSPEDFLRLFSQKEEVTYYPLWESA